MKLPGIIIHNIEIKLVSLVLASLLWLYLIAGRDQEARVQILIDYVNLSSEFRVAANSPDKLDMQIRGSRLAIMLFKADKVRAVLDMRGIGEGIVTFTNLEDAVKGLHGIRVTRTYPGRIDLSVKRAPQG